MVAGVTAKTLRLGGPRIGTPVTDLARVVIPGQVHLRIDVASIKLRQRVGRPIEFLPRWFLARVVASVALVEGQAKLRLGVFARGRRRLEDAEAGLIEPRHIAIETAVG